MKKFLSILLSVFILVSAFSTILMVSADEADSAVISSKLLFTLDENTGWPGAYDTANFVQGTSSLMAGPISAGGLSVHELKLENTIDITALADENTYIQLLFYVNDPALLKEFFIELTSSGTCDNEEIAWSITSENVSAGWNTMNLEIDGQNFARTNGDTKLDAVNYIRMFGFSADEGLVFNMDALRIVKYDAPVEFSSPFTGHVGVNEKISDVQLYSYDTAPGWGVADNTDYLEGTASIDAGTAGGAKVQPLHLDSPVDISFITNPNAYLEMYFYVSDITKFEILHFEISSSGQSDVAEKEWEISSSNLSNGWNLIRFGDIANVKESEGTPDYSAINFSRTFALDCADGLQFKFDDLRAVEYAQPVNDFYVPVIAPVREAPVEETPTEEVPAEEDTHAPTEAPQPDENIDQTDTAEVESPKTGSESLFLMTIMLIASAAIFSILKRRQGNGIN